MTQRVIKFRIWDNGRKEWVHGPGYEVDLFGEAIVLGEILTRPNDTSVSLDELNNLIALQFTGLTDKHGKEIYDGDLISDGTSIWEVRFIDGCFWLYRKGFNAANSMRSWPEDCYPMFRVNHSLYSEIIGNIFTNPELINNGNS